MTRGTLSVAALALIATLTGCQTFPTMATQADRYRIEVRLDPATHHIVGRTAMDLTRVGDVAAAADPRIGVEFLLHPALRVTGVRTGGIEGQYRGVRRRVKSDDGEVTANAHLVVLDGPADALSLFIDYEGKLFQDPSAGEIAGEIHNFTMKAHAGEDGVYLAGGYWYPEPPEVEGGAPALADYILIADEVPGIDLVAGADWDPSLAAQTGRLAWQTPYPTDGMVLVGGPHEVHETTHNGVDISLHLKPSQAEHVDGLFAAVRRNLDRYEPLIGRYPAREFSIVDNFFSSGFAFPTFTLLSSAVIDMGHRAQTAHGYIDHEMLHCWWGNGIHVDTRDGNWCEALASYGANYYGYILDGNESEARRTRRNDAHFLSRLTPDKDKPLGTYGQKDGCGRGIAYSKGAMVFHMLAKKMGQDEFWAAMRRFTAKYVGRAASWEDIRRLCEEVSGESLSTFFEQWVRRGGAPNLRIDSATFDSAEQRLSVTVSQGDPPFEVDVPIRLFHADGSLDITVSLDTPTRTLTVPVSVIPTRVELDPDYQLFRRVSQNDIIPTTGCTRYGTAFASVLPAGEVPEAYTQLRSMFESSFEPHERIALIAGTIQEGALAERCALIVGEAVRDPYVAGFLTAIEFPVRFTNTGFEFQGTRYEDPEDAILCTVSHPGVSGGGVTVVLANSQQAMPPAMNIPMYDRSLVVFKNGSPTLRHDFEPRLAVNVDIVSP